MEQSTKTSGKDAEKVLSRALDFYAKAKDAEEDNRQRFVDDLKFARLGQQWPDGAKRARDQQGRPCLTFNKLPAFIRQVVNDSRMNKPAINILPIGSDADKDTAQVLEGLIRNVEIQSAADIAYDVAIDNAVTGGFGYIRVNLDYPHNDMFDLDISIEQVSNPLSVYGDYNSKKSDGSDWNRALIVEWLPQKEYERKYGKKDASDWEHDFADAPEWITEDSVLVAEYWEREEYDRPIYQLSTGQVVDDEYLKEFDDGIKTAGIEIINERISKAYRVTQYILSGAEVLETNQWAGQYIPIIPVYGDEVVEDGKRHLFGLIHQARGAQESYNYWRTSAVEKVALDTKSPWIGPKGAFNADTGKWMTANTQNHAFIEYDGPVPPQRTPAGGVPAGDIQMALSAADDMKSIIGIYDASLGARSNETSGKAIMARQREGDVSTFHFIDNMSRAIRQLGKVMVDLIPKVYTSARIIRTLAEDGTPSEVQINQEYLEKGITKLHDLTVGKYDVVVKSGPSFTSRREESAQQMMQLIQSFPQAAPLVGDLVAKNLEWPGSDEIAERFRAMLPPELQKKDDDEQSIPPQVQQQMQLMSQQMQQMQALIDGGMQQMQAITQENDLLKMQMRDKSTELAIKAKELDIKAREVMVNEAEGRAEIQLKAAEIINESAQKSGERNAQMIEQFQSLIEQVVNTQQTLASAASAPKEQPRPRRKQARAFKQPDGSWAMESVESDE